MKYPQFIHKRYVTIGNVIIGSIDCFRLVIRSVRTMRKNFVIYLQNVSLSVHFTMSGIQS